jgi:hypothetical protein
MYAPIKSNPELLRVMDKEKLAEIKQKILNRINLYIGQGVEKLIKKGDTKIDEKLPSSNQIWDEIVKHLDNGTNPNNEDIIIHGRRRRAGNNPFDAWRKKFLLLKYAEYNDYLKILLAGPPKAPSVPLDMIIKAGKTVVSVPPLK